MSMTWEEAIELICYGDWLNILMSHLGDDDINRLAEAMCIIGNALRPVSRDQVEKMWVGCEYCEKHKINLVRIEMNYNDSPGSPKRLNPTRVPKFCPMCGRPLTDEAVEMVMRRLEALHEIPPTT